MPTYEHRAEARVVEITFPDGSVLGNCQLRVFKRTDIGWYVFRGNQFHAEKLAKRSATVEPRRTLS